MKKLLAITMIFLAVFACSRKTTPPEEIILSNTPVTRKAASPSVDSTEIVVAGKLVYVNRCGRCHALKPLANYTEQAWENILKAMIPKAGLNEAEAKDLREYVMVHAKK